MYNLSIITINYNDSEGLKKTIESVLNQKFRNFEYIVIDGDSNDESKDVILKYSEKINYWISEKDTGIYNAMNKGVLNANGEYLIFLNSGDTFFSEDSIFYFSEFLNNKKYDFVYGNLSVIEGMNTFIKKYPSKLTFQNFIKDSIPFPCTIFKKNIIEEMGLFDENLKIVSDWKFFINAICKFNKSYIHLDEIIVNFNLDGISSKNKDLVRIEREKVLNEDFTFFIDDYRELLIYKTKVVDLRKSNRIKLLQKLKILNEF